MYNQIIVIVLVVGSFVGYFKYTQDKIAVLVENNAKLTIANQTNQKTISLMEEATEQLEEANEELTLGLQKSEKYVDELKHTLQKHNLTMLAKKKPGLIEKRINNASKKLFTDITNDSSF